MVIWDYVNKTELNEMNCSKLRAETQENSQSAFLTLRYQVIMYAFQQMKSLRQLCFLDDQAQWEAFWFVDQEPRK